MGGRALVLITGAAGGLGRVLARELARDHSVVGVVHREAMPADLREAGVEELNADLDGEVGFGALADRLGSCRLRAVVHAAWPGAPRGGLLSAGDEGIRRQVEFGTLTTIRLARLLASRAEAGARMVAIGSTAASIAPSPSLAIYALGKSCLEQAVRFLAPELARKGIAVNAVCPSFVPVGINRGAGERQRLMEQASVPMGRLCTPEDVAGVVRFLLGPGSEFLSGQVFGLTGGSI